MRVLVGLVPAATAALLSLGLGAAHAADLPDEFAALSMDVKAAGRQLNERMTSEQEAPLLMAEQNSLWGDVFDASVPADLKAQMRADLTFIQDIQGIGASSLHQQVFGSVDGPAYIRFLKSRVKAVSMGDCLIPAAIAFVRRDIDHSKMWLTPNYTKFNHPQIARMMIVFHESRHMEAAEWPHVNCPQPFWDTDGQDIRSVWSGTPLAGLPGCDETALGSYGIAAVMLKNIQLLCVNCTDKVAMDAGLYADDQVKRIIDPAARKILQDDLYR